jgi:murein DD-endopeptidase MepM/ murein hydrolase activator NlpD
MPNTVFLCFIGGRFEESPSRPSGYFHKFSQAVIAQWGEGSRVLVINGGAYADLERQLPEMHEITHLFWFADIPNEFPKLLPRIKQQNPKMVLIQSKNNRAGKYSREELYARMHASHAELLVEFTQQLEPPCIKASLLAVAGSVELESAVTVAEVGSAVVKYLKGLNSLYPPLMKTAVLTADADSFVQRDFRYQTEVPLGLHPGAFGVTRRNHVHEGVDLYTEPNTPVYAMESGQVVCVQPFTGSSAGSPWWADTQCLLIAGAHGVLNYGEIAITPGIEEGTRIEKGQLIGRVLRVLRNNKGRPGHMLHVERYRVGTTRPVTEWPLATAQPTSLIDPTDLLVGAFSAMTLEN